MIVSYSRRRFTAREDATLKRLVEKLGTDDWTMIARRMTNRTAKQCRDRFENYLSDALNHGQWTAEEDKQIAQLVEQFGTKWKQLAQIVGNRSANALKNRWYKVLDKHPSCTSESNKILDWNEFDFGNGMTLSDAEYTQIDDFFGNL